MKLYRYLFLVLAFLLSPIVCQAESVVGFLIPVSGLGDQSFNDMTYAGLVKAKNAYNFRLIRRIVDGNDRQSHTRAMDELIAQEADVIVTNGWEFNTLIKEYSQRYPDKYFIINDFPVSGIPNVISTVFDQHEASFLAGALAAWTTQTGKIGFIGGKDMPVIHAFLTGYREGAQYARSDIKIDVVYLSQADEQTAGFDDPALAFAKANEMFGNKVDIIFGVAGLAGNGVIRAAVQNDTFAIGVDADQDYTAKGHVLTSVIKRLDKATFEALKLIFKGNFKPGVYSFGLAENGVDLSPMTYTYDLVPEAVHEKLKRLKQKIIAGEIIVTNVLDINQSQ